MSLEDDFSDILKKARTGQGLSVGDVARMTGLPGGDITALERGDHPRDRAEYRRMLFLCAAIHPFHHQAADTSAPFSSKDLVDPLPVGFRA